MSSTTRRAALALAIVLLIGAGFPLARHGAGVRKARGIVTAQAVGVTPAVPVDSSAPGRGNVSTWADVSILTAGERERGGQPGERLPRQFEVPRIPEPAAPAPPAPPPGPAPATPSAPPAESAPAASPPGAESTPPARSSNATDSTSAASAPDLADASLVPPVLLKAAWLKYPDEALKRKAEGQVEVRILVGVDGSVTSVELTQAQVDTSLARAATQSARAMKFRPATRGGRPVPVWYNYRFDFSLPRSG